MRRSFATYFLIWVLTVLTVVSGYFYFHRSEPVVVEAPRVVVPTPEPSPEATFASTEAKVAQLLAVPVNISTSPSGELSASNQEFVAQVNPGFVVLFGSRVSRSSAEQVIQEVRQSAAEFKPLIAVDHEGGLVQRLSGAGFTKLPSWAELCTLSDAARYEQLLSSAQELRSTGVAYVFAPVVDVAATQSGVLASRTCSADPVAVKEAAVDFVSAFSQAGVSSVLKHFPGIGLVARDLHTHFDTTTVDQDAVEIFHQVEAFYPGTAVMTSHVGIENQNALIPCSVSQDCVGEFAQTYPDSLIFTDALEMDAARFQASPAGSLKPLDVVAREAVLAGNDVLVFGAEVTTAQLQEVLATLVATYESSEEFRERVELSVEKITRRKLQEGALHAVE